MKKFASHFFFLRATDLLVVIFAIFLSLLNIVFHESVDRWFLLVTLNLFTIFFVIVVAYLDEYHTNIFWNQLHYWYIVPLIFLSFKELYFMVKPIRGIDYDQTLIEIDRFLFGVDPTHFLFQIANPFLTELLQIVYATFFFLPILLAVDLIFNGRIKAFQFTTFIIVYGFFLSYIGYFIVPAVGPRFTLHDFGSTDVELPGLLLTNYLREIVNTGESIPHGTINPADFVQRDVFPSGHTEITLLVMYLSVKFRTFTRYALIPVGTLLIFSTVYLRYHYVIDLIAGFLFMVLTLWTGYKLYNFWMKLKGKELFLYNDS